MASKPTRTVLEKRIKYLEEECAKGKKIKAILRQNSS